MAAAGAQDLTSRVAAGGELPLDATVRYTLVVTRLPTEVKALHLVGNGATLEVTDAPAKPGTVSFTDCTFEGVVFTAPSFTNPKIPIAGYGNARNTFRGCTFLDYAPSIVYQHGRGLLFEKNRVIASDHPPEAMQSNLFCPLGDFVFQQNEMNFPPGGPPLKGATGILVGASGPASAGQEFSNWRIRDNRFLDADRPGYCIDTIVDVEAGRGSMRDIRVERNICFNGKVDVNSGDDVWVTDNRWRITKNHVPKQGAQASLLYIIATGASEVGSIHIERNVYVQDADAPATTRAQAVLVVPQVRVKELVIKDNTFVVNGGGVPPFPNGVVGLHLRPEADAGVGMERIEISGNSFGFSALPAQPGPLIVVNNPAPAPGRGFGSVTVTNNRLLAGTTLEVGPALVGGPLLAHFLRVGSPANTVSVAELTLTGNSVAAGTVAGKWLITPPSGATIQRSTVQGNTPALKGD
jgi:hypothetical protein